MPKKLTQEEWINKARSIHGDKYDYSLVEYKDTKTEVKIICKEHGLFSKTPNSHTHKKMKQGCSKCSSSSYDINEFVNKAKIIHGDKYDYSLADYKGSRSKIIIVCPIHGQFEQEANSHLKGVNCYKCVRNNLPQNNPHSIEAFLTKANFIHYNKFDYSKSIYINSRSNINIICPKHGEFFVKANNHLNGVGCPKCSVSKGELVIRNYLNENEINFKEQKTC